MNIPQIIINNLLIDNELINLEEDWDFREYVLNLWSNMSDRQKRDYIIEIIEKMESSIELIKQNISLTEDFYKTLFK